MGNMLKALLQEEKDYVVSSVFSEDQSPKSTEQEEVIQNGTDVGICKVDATQDCLKTPARKPQIE